MPSHLPETPDGRYFVTGGRLWRRSNPALPEAERERLVHDLMDARRAVGQATRAGDAAAEKDARARVHAAKVALGERGPTWWDGDDAQPPRAEEHALRRVVGRPLGRRAGRRRVTPR